MADRLFVAVLGHRKSGKSKTWDTLFGQKVRTGKQSRMLELLPGECVEVFLISGSNEERDQYAGDVLENQAARIILCSVQYVEAASATIEYITEQDFWLYVQWLNPGYHDVDQQYADYLGIANRLTYNNGGLIAVRSGKKHLNERIQEIKEFIYGWAKYRNLIVPCP
jgi:hypothetical protein